MISGMTYIPNYIDRVGADYLVSCIDEKPWSNELKRRTQHYGYKYDYTRRSINESMKVEDIPNFMIAITKSITDYASFKEMPDQVIINEYLPGQGIAAHIDCVPCFKNKIVSLSLLSPVIMEFSKGFDKFELELEPRSLLILDGIARYEWYHCIPARKVDYGVARERRISLTFRKVILSDKEQIAF